jgi:hypothetical protein
MNIDSYISPTAAESFVQLKYFSPFNIHEIPYDVLEEVHIQAFGFEYKKRHSRTWPAPQSPITFVLEREADTKELQRGIKKILVERHK